MINELLSKLYKDRYYFLVWFGLNLFVVFIILYQEEFVAVASQEVYGYNLLGDYYEINIFDGIIFTGFIIITIFMGWYFGGHNALLVIGISWNFEVALFIAVTGRWELIVEFVNLFLFASLYFIESPADKRRRLQLETIQNQNQELQIINQSFARFVPSEFAALLQKESLIHLKLGDSIQKELTLFFLDIRSFSRISELLSPQETFQLLNAFFQKVSPVIRKNNGFIDKYLGDGIMAVFPAHPKDAIVAAWEIQNKVKEIDLQKCKLPMEKLKIGIGIHYGLSIIGAVGEEKRIDSTVISDAVNIACRLEGLTKDLKAEVIVSKDIFEQVHDLEGVNFISAGSVNLKSKETPLDIYTVEWDDHFTLENSQKTPVL